ncbi:MAG: polymer-forming cytoskeletal protein [Dissulfurispiraceae bacterium]|jgi:cytoskeletal protein CcmA (bactofilin family)|nr:polymer-forming cytoskeletal protein [Dissulfurispiraceae bacterium]
MFSRKNDKFDTLIGNSSELNGTVIVNGTLRIDGRFTGNITADWVIIGSSADLSGDISARGVVIGSRMHGNIEASELVEIKPKGMLYGDVKTKKLTVAEGAVFEGRSFIHKEAAEPDTTEDQD